MKCLLFEMKTNVADNNALPQIQIIKAAEVKIPRQKMMNKEVRYLFVIDATTI